MNNEKLKIFFDMGLKSFEEITKNKYYISSVDLSGKILYASVVKSTELTTKVYDYKAITSFNFFKVVAQVSKQERGFVTSHLN